MAHRRAFASCLLIVGCMACGATDSTAPGTDSSSGSRNASGTATGSTSGIAGGVASGSSSGGSIGTTGSAVTGSSDTGSSDTGAAGAAGSTGSTGDVPASGSRNSASGAASGAGSAMADAGAAMQDAAGSSPDSSAESDATSPPTHDAATTEAGATPDAGADSPFVKVCGTSLCLHGKPFRVKGATAYGEYQNPSSEMAAAQAANVNTLEIVEFENQFHTLSDTMSEGTWSRVDKFVAAASSAGLHVIFNLSSYGQSLEASGKTATTADWQSYLQFITTRTNTVSHVKYANDPTIVMWEIFGEIPQPNGQGTNGTSQQMTDFYHRTLTELAALDPNHVRSSGGFSYLDAPNASGIDWKTIMNDPVNQVCAVEVNASGDRNTSVPMVSQYCKGIGKPWFLAAWSSCIGSNPGFTGDLDNYPTDADGATHALDMYAVASNTGVSGTAPAMAAIGSDFWNLGSGTAPTCNLNPGFPKTFAAVKGAQ